VGLERRLVLFDLNTARLTDTGLTIGDDERVIINDGIAIEGGVLFGTKHLEFNQPIAALYRLDSATRTIHTVLGGQICSNGKYLREGGGGIRLIDIDSLPKAIRCYHFSVDWERRSEHLVTPPEALPAFPDGLRETPDGESVVVAFYNPEPVAAGLAQEICLASGAVLNEWEFPGSPRVTCPEFAEIGGRVCLLFTTAVEGMPDAHRAGAPEAGTLFVAQTPFASLPAAPPLVAVGR
jgi:sugar lactone lactonase YvrE